MISQSLEDPMTMPTCTAAEEEEGEEEEGLDMWDLAGARRMSRASV
ncbi:hypothetical protein [Pigmentiphaga sp. NML080357]|nr:hypothetical protein [Pigmentiphaga sp. NML080357]